MSDRPGNLLVVSKTSSIPAASTSGIPCKTGDSRKVPGDESHRRTHRHADSWLYAWALRAVLATVAVVAFLLLTGPMPAHSAPARHSVLASYYGPGLYGNPVACPGRARLRPGTLGVAHRTLPCGTWVCLTAGRRRVCVQVIDRGPFVSGRVFDLTAATHRRLGLSCGVCRVTYTTGKRR